MVLERTLVCLFSYLFLRLPWKAALLTYRELGLILSVFSSTESFTGRKDKNKKVAISI